MPAYNASKFINRAVQSLSESTFTCDLFIVDDGSEVPVTEVLSKNSEAYVVRLNQNCGIAHARNVGLTEILRHSYEFVACLDADDICYPERIAKQVDFLDSNPGVAAVGTWGRHFVENSGETICIKQTPTSPASTKKAMHSNCSMINTSAMIRTSAFRAVGLYSERYPAAEDYELFKRISKQFVITNIPEVLVDICVSREGTSLKRRRRQLVDRLRIQLKYIEPVKPLAWLGLARTFILFLVPASLHSRTKSTNKRFYGSVGALLGNRRAL